MQNPDKLRVSKEAEDLAIAVYEYTDEFPRDERYGVTAQMRREAVSIGSNIFEGCSRQTNKSFVAYLYNAHGSAGEILFQLRIARKRHCGDDAKADAVYRGLITIRRMLSRLIRNVGDKRS
ncbi:MAG TPA: four helix bundle protein [Gemmatimonadaceae bacterium]|nr:four helix bundle protein [Gemmatimonadaceae bacterium]